MKKEEIHQKLNEFRKIMREVYHMKTGAYLD